MAPVTGEGQFRSALHDGDITMRGGMRARCSMRDGGAVDGDHLLAVGAAEIHAKRARVQSRWSQSSLRCESIGNGSDVELAGDDAQRLAAAKGLQVEVQHLRMTGEVPSFVERGGGTFEAGMEGLLHATGDGQLRQVAVELREDEPVRLALDGPAQFRFTVETERARGLHVATGFDVDEVVVRTRRTDADLPGIHGDCTGDAPQRYHATTDQRDVCGIHLHGVAVDAQQCRQEARLPQWTLLRIAQHDHTDMRGLHLGQRDPLQHQQRQQFDPAAGAFDRHIRQPVLDAQPFHGESIHQRTGHVAGRDGHGPRLAQAAHDQLQSPLGGRDHVQRGAGYQQQWRQQDQQYLAATAHSCVEMFRCRRTSPLVDSGLATSIPSDTTSCSR